MSITDSDSDTRRRPAALHAARGGELLSMDDAAGAQACFQQALAFDPDNVFALANLAWMREQEDALEHAVALYLRALAHMPDDVHLLQNLGALLLRMRRMDEAGKILRRVLALEPERSSAWSNLGVLQASLQRETQAERCYRHAMELDPAYANARYNLAYLLLRQGRLAEGWQMLEARPQPSAFGDYFHFPRWQG